MGTPGVKKLTFLVSTMATRGGMERVTATVANGLAERGFDVELLALRGEHSTYPLAPQVRFSPLCLDNEHLRLRSWRTQTLPFLRAVRRHLRQRRPDVVIAVDTFLSVYAYPAALELGVRRVAWEHFNFHFDFGMPTRRFGRRVAAFLGHDVVTLTEQDAAEWRRRLPGAPARLSTITNPLPFALPASNPYALENRTALAVGWLTSRKGFDLLLDAWAGVEAEFPEWSLRIVGSGPDEADLRAQAERLGLRRWHLLPQTDTIEQEYRAAGVFCLSSRHEGLPMVLIESQAHGVPAVAFDCPTGPAELLAPGGGLLVQAGDVPGFTEALRRALSNARLRQELSARAYEASHQRRLDEVLDNWTELLASARGRPRWAPVRLFRRS